MNYISLFKQALSAGHNEIEAAQIARTKLAIQNTLRIKGRNINDSHYAGAINVG